MTLNTLGLDLQMFMNPHVGPENRTRVLLQEQSVFLTSETSLQPINVFLK